MGRHKKFAREDVINAAETLLTNGKQITASSLRGIIGCGRPENIYELYLQLNEEGVIKLPESDSSAKVKLVTHDLPPEIGERLPVFLADIEAMVHDINNYAHQIVERRLNSALSEANLRVEQADNREKEAVKQLEIAYNDLEDSAEIIEKQEDEITKLQKQVESLTHKLDKQTTISNDAKTLVSEHAETIRISKEENQKLQESLSSANIKIASVESKLDVAEQTITELKASNKALQNSAKKTDAENIKLKTTLDIKEEAAAANTQSLKNQIERITDQLAKAQNQSKTEIEKLSNENAMLKYELEQLKANSTNS